MIAAKPFDSHNLTLADARRRRFNGIIRSNRLATVIMKSDMRPAFVTGIGLGMKSPVGRVVVLGLAGSTHFKIPHGGLGAIIGDIIDDGIARPAIGAIDKRIQIAAISGIEKLLAAIITDRYVRRDQGGHPGLAPAFGDPEFRKGLYGFSVPGYFDHVGQRGTIGRQRCFKGLDVLRRAFNQNRYPGGGVGHFAF